MQIAQVLAGYSLGEADLLRRAMGKKNPEEMAKQKGRFVKGAVSRGHDEQKSSELFDLLAKFAEYGFNKSHSAAYGYVAYQTAWLKAHHRAEYMAALMTIDAGDSDKILVYLNDCRRAGLRVLPPDVLASELAFDVPATDRSAIRYGLAAVKGLGENAILAILESRRVAGGRFRDFLDFLTRMDWRRVNRKVLESLIKCGALDSLGEPRARMFGGLEEGMAAAHAEQARAASGQVGLFGQRIAPTLRLPSVGEWPIGERMRYEKETLGLFITDHPVRAFADEAQRWASGSIEELERTEEGREVRLCGIVTGQRVIRTKRGDKMAFVTLEDPTGTVDCVFFSDAFSRSQSALGGDRPLLVTGKLERREGTLTIRAESVEPMEDLRERNTRVVEIRLRAEVVDGAVVDELRALLGAHRGGCATSFTVLDAGQFRAELSVAPDWKVAASPRLVDGLRSHPAVAEVRLG